MRGSAFFDLAAVRSCEKSAKLDYRPIGKSDIGFSNPTIPYAYFTNPGKRLIIPIVKQVSAERRRIKKGDCRQKGDVT